MFFLFSNIFNSVLGHVNLNANFNLYLVLGFYVRLYSTNFLVDFGPTRKGTVWYLLVQLLLARARCLYLTVLYSILY